MLSTFKKTQSKLKQLSKHMKTTLSIQIQKIIFIGGMSIVCSRGVMEVYGGWMIHYIHHFFIICLHVKTKGESFKSLNMTSQSIFIFMSCHGKSSIMEVMEVMEDMWK